MFKNKNFPAFACLLIVLSLVYLPVLQYAYVFHDGVWFFKNDPGSFGLHPLHMKLTAAGRFSAAFLFTLAGWFINKIGDLRVIRLLSIFQIILSSWIFFIYFKKYLTDGFFAVMASVIIFTLPPFQSAVANEGHFYTVVGLLLSLCAGLLAGKIPPEKTLFRQVIDKHSLAAVLALLYAITFYQTTAMFYWVFVAIFILSNSNGEFSKTIKSARGFYLVGFITLIIYTGVLKLIEPSYRYLAWSIYDPYTVNFDLIRKLKWFFREPLLNSLNLWNIFPKVSYAVIVASAIASAALRNMFLYFKREKDADLRKGYWQKLFFYLFLFISLFFLSFLPNLAPKGDAPFYRCCAGLTTLIAIALIWALNEWVSVFPLNFRKRVLALVLLSGCLWGAFRAYQTVLYFRAIPSYIEKMYVKNILKNSDLDQYKTIYLIRPDLPSLGLKSRYDEFGILTTNYLGPKRAFLAAVLRELGVKNTEQYAEQWNIVYVLSVEDWYVFEESALVIDMRKMFDHYPEYLSLLKERQR